ncbi:poly-gamma-glutamate hydrolase family protein [Rhodococcus sp. NPDC056960]|uniref:poly-gamma-glutamate hydrolase family protein n=1 Tax=Rhodococcus sp. NPDC056960 TaxID=3345982 RepID=UPI0036256025
MKHGDDEHDALGAQPFAVAVHLEVRRSRSANAHVAEHLRIHPRMLARLGARPRQQARVSHRGKTALFTLIPDTDPTAIDTIRIAECGRRRLGVEPGHAVSLDLRCIDPGMTERQARIDGEFIERLVDDGHHRRLAVLAPHGGAIEARTDRQAEQVVDLLGSGNSTLWTCKGWRPDGNAYSAWHISSGDLSVHSFPLLRSLAARPFRWAVSFHGYSGTEVLVGGLAPDRLRSDVRNAIARVLDGSGVGVRVADPGERCSGRSPANLVNRLTVDAAGGVQIEQCLAARMKYGSAIADAVSGVYKSWISPDPGVDTALRFLP